MTTGVSVSPPGVVSAAGVSTICSEVAAGVEVSEGTSVGSGDGVGVGSVACPQAASSIANKTINCETRSMWRDIPEPISRL
jgi:hypothetical protein